VGRPSGLGIYAAKGWMQEVPRIESPQSERVEGSITQFQNVLHGSIVSSEILKAKIFASSRHSDGRRTPLGDLHCISSPGNRAPCISQPYPSPSPSQTIKLKSASAGTTRSTISMSTWHRNSQVKRRHPLNLPLRHQQIDPVIETIQCYGISFFVCRSASSMK
jgi:hypothetical protein